MAKQELWQYTKKTSFWLTYTVLLGGFSIVLFYVIQEQYYILTDYSFWRYNFTVFPPFKTPQQPVLKEYLDVIFYLFLISIPCIYNYYLIFKRKNKKNGMIVLLLALVLSFVYGFFRCKFITYCG